jgi:UDP-N-acetylmuramoyl-L-alanyl-D-glutamate--2,6-diaminopimelate ligase
MNICKESKKAFSKKVVTIFGCGGDRDVTKRPLMGIAACNYSDEVVITSDNPRFENLDNILKDITDGLDEFNNYKVIKDRPSAIKETINSTANSIILILGKGHEPYLDIMGTKIDYSDIDTVAECIND